MTWPSRSWSINEREPWRMPGRPPRMAAACRPVSMPSPAASATARRTVGSPMNLASSLIAFEPPPTQAMARSGDVPPPPELGGRLVADAPLEVAHDRRVRVRAHRRAQDVRGLDVGDPQSRIASLTASLRMAGVTERTSAPRARIRRTLAPGARCPRRPCTRRTAGRGGHTRSPWRPRAGRRRSRRSRGSCRRRRVRSAWPRALLILCAPVWARSSRLR